MTRSSTASHRAKDLELQRVREMDAIKARFLNLAAHELSTPLTPTRLQLHMLAEGMLGPLTPQQKTAVSVAARNVERLVTIVAELVEVTRLETGHVRLRAEAFQVGTVLLETIETYAEAARSIGVTLQVEATHDLSLQADRGRTVQIMNSLVSNALKFTPKGGRVTMAAWQAGETVILEVRDTGAGMTQAQVDALFQPFSQVHDPMEQTAAGAGLGLYLCRRLAAAMAGTIQCASAGPGRGSTFRVVLPRVAPGSDPGQPEPPQRPADAADWARRIRELI